MKKNKVEGLTHQMSKPLGGCQRWGEEGGQNGRMGSKCANFHLGHGDV